jgi:hypothetical protein
MNRSFCNASWRNLSSGVEFLFVCPVFWIWGLEIAGFHIPPSISCASPWRGGEQRIMHVSILICNVLKTIKCQKYSGTYKRRKKVLTDFKTIIRNIYTVFL